MRYSNRGHFFFSAEQWRVRESLNMPIIFCKLDRKSKNYTSIGCSIPENQTVEYTEKHDSPIPYSKWKDFIYLGEGEFSHVVAT